MSSSLSLPVGPEHEDVRRVRVAVEEPVAEDHRHPRLGHQVGESPPLVERVAVGLHVRELEPFEQLQREHALPGVAPVHARDPDVGVPGEVPVEGLGVARLLAVVELVPDRPGELVDELARIDEVERTDALLGDPGRLVEELEVGLDLPRRLRALHLDRDRAAVGEHRAMHLADRGGRHRRRVELEEELLDRELQVLADHPLDLGEREGRGVVLERPQLRDDVRRDDVRAGREQLPELDERRTELVEHLAQVLAPRGPAGLGLQARHRRARPRQQVGQLVGLEEVAEPVPDRDLGDLGHAPEAALRRLRHAFSVARPVGGLPWLRRR
jgi:hypothetical protein